MSLEWNPSDWPVADTNTGTGIKVVHILSGAEAVFKMYGNRIFNWLEAVGDLRDTTTFLNWFADNTSDNPFFEGSILLYNWDSTTEGWVLEDKT